MKKILFWALLILSFESIAKTDTTIVEFNDKTLKNKIKVITSNDKLLNLPKNLNLNEILKSVGVDTSDRKKALILMNGQKDTVLVLSSNGNQIKIFSKEKIFKQNNPINTPDIAEKNIEIEKEEEIVIQKPNRNKTFFSKNDFGFYIGLNNFFNQNPQAPSRQYGLRNWPSRYFGFSFRHTVLLSSNETIETALSFSPGFGFHNFMFNNSTIATMVNDQVVFAESGKSTTRSKLVEPFAELPLMLHIGHKPSRFHLGIGGFIGYRIGGYTRVKFDDGTKLKKGNNYGMNDVLYGIMAEAGFKKAITVFVKYNLNTMFKANQVNGQDLQVFSFGIRL